MWVMGGIGFQLGLELQEDGRLAVNASYAKEDTDKYSSIKGNVYLHTNVWCDIATVFDGSKVSFYAITNGGPLQVSSVEVSPKSAIYEGLYLGLYQSGRNSATAKTPFIWSLRGTIAQVAFWNRALSEREVRGVMAFPALDVFRLGIENGSSGEFGVDASTAELSVVADVDAWGVAPFNLPPNVPVSYTFTADALAASLPQILQLTSLPGSDAGSLAVELNGIRLASLNAAPGLTTSVHVPANTLVAGAPNVLTLTGRSSGTVHMDALALGGSVQAGEDNNAISEFGRRDASLSIDNIDGLWNEWSFVDYDIGPEQTNEIRVSVSECAARRHKWLFELDAYSPATSQSENDYGVTLLVNGMEVHHSWFPNGQRHHVFAAKLPAGFLCPGVNSLSVVAHVSDSRDQKRWLYIDCWRLSVQEAPVPFCITVR